MRVRCRSAGPHASLARMTDRDRLSRECASLIEDAEEELRAIRAAFRAHAIFMAKAAELRIAPAPLRRSAPEGAPPPLPEQAVVRIASDKP